MVRRNLLTRNGQGTPIPLGGNLTRSMMSSSLPALLSVPPDQFYGTVAVPNAQAMQVESASRGQSNADTHCMDQEDMKALSGGWYLRN